MTVGYPDLAAWQDSPARPPAGPPPACRVGYCSLWTQGTSVFGLGHDNRWKGNGRTDVEEFIASCENPGPGHEHVDLRRLPASLRLEVQYVLQCRDTDSTCAGIVLAKFATTAGHRATRRPRRAHPACVKQPSRSIPIGSG